MFAHKQYPFLTCNPDGLLYQPSGGILLFEAKTAFRMKADEWKAGIPDYYAPQPVHYMEVLNDPRITKGFIGVCLGGNPQDRIDHSFTRDPIAGAAQIQKLVEFWQKYIVAGVEPPLTGDPELDHIALYDYVNSLLPANASTLPSPASASVTADADTEALIAEYRELVTKRKDLNKEVRTLKASEDILSQQISDAIPEGEWLVKKEKSMTYRIRKKENRKKIVDSDALQKLPLETRNALRFVSRHLSQTSTDYSTPLVK